jgi:hypothetical protein
MKYVLAALLILVSGAWADWPLEIIPLKHQTVDQILPMLKPFAGPDSTVTGMNGQLVIKASPENPAQLKQIIRHFYRERQHQDMTSGFYVTPWVSGDRVTGRLGEWIDLGGVIRNGQGIPNTGSVAVTGRSPMRVKVEPLSE